MDRTFRLIQKPYIKTGKQLFTLCMIYHSLISADLFKKFINKAVYVSGKTPAYNVNLLGCTVQGGWEKLVFALKKVQYQDLFLTLENNFKRGNCSVMGGRFFNSDEEARGLYIDANNLYGWEMNETLPYKGVRFNSQVSLKDVPETDDFAETGYFIRVNVICPEKIK